MSERILRGPETDRKCGISRSQRYKLEAEGRFPARVRLTERSIGYLESELEAWISNRVRDSRGEAV